MNRRPCPNFSSVAACMAALSLIWAGDPSPFPADSLLSEPGTGLLARIAIMPVAAWQRISYRTDFLNCQFEPSCSNYGALAIRDQGVFHGTFLATDRIMRCHPEAFHYHLLSGGQVLQDGRLYDPVGPPAESPGGWRPILSAALSAIVPGAGRVYNGRFIEGVLSGMTIFLLGQVAWSAFRNDQGYFPVAVGIFTAFYGGEIAGSYRLGNQRNSRGVK